MTSISTTRPHTTVEERQDGRVIIVSGPDASGNATPALLKRLAALGADASVVAQLRRENDGKAEVLFYDSVAKGVTLVEGLQKALEAAIGALPIPKVMTYQLADGWSTGNFVRPVHGLLALHAFPGRVHDLAVGDEQRGHGLGVAGVVGLGERIGQEPDCLIVRRRRL